MEKQPDTTTIIKEEPVSIWKKLKYALGAILGIMVCVLIFQNWKDVPLNLLVKEYLIPFPLIIIFALLTGYLWGSFSGYQRMQRKNKDIRNLQKRVIDQNDHINTLRSSNEPTVL